MFSYTWKKGALKSSKHHSYLEVYDFIFFPYKGKKVKILEFGVSTGGSLESYANYFAADSIIIGVDMDPACAEINFSANNIEILIGDMTNPDLYEKLKNNYGYFDFIIDDGGHTNFQMTSAFVNSINILNKNAIYIAEDTHCSYLTKFNNPSKLSFMSFVKNMMDKLSVRYLHFKSGLTLVNISVYPGIVVFKFIESFIQGNPQIYNEGYKTINAVDHRFSGNVSLIQLFMLNMYNRLSYSYISSGASKFPLLKTILIKFYVLVLTIFSSDTFKVVNIRNKFNNMISKN